MESSQTTPPPSEEEQLASWVTLAFLDIAAADGALDVRELETCGRILRTAGLPDVLARDGLEALQARQKNGELAQLTERLASADRNIRLTIARLLMELVKADDYIDPKELQAVEAHLTSLGLTSEDLTSVASNNKRAWLFLGLFVFFLGLAIAGFLTDLTHGRLWLLLLPLGLSVASWFGYAWQTEVEGEGHD